MQRVIDNTDEHFIFIEAALNALENIGWYGETEFTCPICGCTSAKAKRIRLVNNSRNKATWLTCEECGKYVHG